MTFLQPAWLALLLLAPLVALLHVRRPRRVKASSVVVWRRLAQDGAEAGGGKGGSRSLSLVLQLLTLLVISLALARPTLGFDAGILHRIYLVDGSYRMLADEDHGRPFDRALNWLSAELRGVPNRVAVTVVVAGHRPQALLVRAAGPLSADGLDAAEAWASAADWPSAVNLVRGTVDPSEGTSLTVLTTKGADFGWVESWESFGPRGVEPRVLTFGEGGPNVGLVAAEIRPDAAAANRYVIAGAVAATDQFDGLQVVVEQEQDQPGVFKEVARLPVDVLPPAVAEFESSLSLAATGSVRLSLQQSDRPIVDSQAVDDTVALPVVVRPARLLLIGDATSPLARVLTLLPGVETYVARDLTPQVDDFDLVIVTDPLVSGIPQTSTLWFGTVPGGVAEVPRLTAPELTAWSRDHPLAASDWTELIVDRAFAGPLLPGATAVLSSGAVPLIQARAVDVGYQVVVAFPLEGSNWAEQASFPAFLAQVVDQVVPLERRAGSSACVVAEPCRLGARHSEPGSGVVLPGGDAWPPEGAWTGDSDQFSTGHWLPVVSDFTLVPRLPGSILALDSAESSSLPVLPARSGFLVGERDADEQQASVAQGDELSAPAPVSVDPSAFLIAVAIVLVLANGALLWGRRVRWFRNKSLLAHGLTALVLAASVAAILRVPLVRPREAPRTLVVVDDRVPAAAKLASAQPGVTIIGIGAEPTYAAENPESLKVAATDLVTGLELAVGISTAINSSSVTILPIADDGLLPLAAVEAARSAWARGVQIDVVPPSEPGRPEVHIDTVIVPGELRAGETVEVVAAIDTIAELSGVLSVAFDDVTVFEADVDLLAGDNGLRFPLHFEDAKESRLRLSLSSSTGDVLATAEIMVLVEEPPTALIAAADPAAASTMARALELQGFAVDVQPVLNVPWSLDGWTDKDVLVLLDVSAHSLHSTQLDTLEEWVGSRGGGLLLLGGTESFGPGGYLRTPLDAMSPLSSQVPDEAPEVTMVFVIDRSGSMQQAVGDTTRMGIAKEATVAAVELLGAGSKIGVVAYDEAAHVLVPLIDVERVDEIATAVDGIRANGGTALHPALVEAANMLTDVDSAAIHVVVLTDGMSQPADFRTAIGVLKELGASVSFVGIGSGTDQIQLNDLAAMAGGALHITNDVRALPSILAQEALMASKDLVHTGRFAVVRKEPASVLSRALPRNGEIGGYVLTETKDGAQVLASTFEDEEAPLLATWRYGLGRVVAFASHGAGPWTKEWLTGEDYPLAWGQLARWSAASSVPVTSTLSLASYGMAIDVTLRAYEEDGSPATGRVLRVDVFDAEGPLGVRVLEEATPGTYRSLLSVSQEGEYRAVVKEASGEALAEGRVLVNESGPGRSEPSASLVLPRLTGGTLHAVGTTVDNTASVRWSWQPAEWPWLMLALLCFLVYLLIVYGVPRWSDVVWALRSLRPFPLVRPDTTRDND